MSPMIRTIAQWLTVGVLLSLQGCASVKVVNQLDPWEPMNRRVYAFNDALDTVALKPVAQAYDQVVPGPVRLGLRNFLGNLGDVWTLVNLSLQWKAEAAVETLMRINVNTVFGFGGVIDVASEMRLKNHKEDFGQTLGHWGVKPGPYLVLPLLGPSTLRDTLATPVDMRGNVASEIYDRDAQTALSVVNVVEVRAGFLNTLDVIKGAALDPYTFVRDGYLQKREYDVHDGNPPSNFDYSESETP